MSEKGPNVIVKIFMLLWYCISFPFLWIWKKLSGYFKNLNYPRIGSKILKVVGGFMHWLIFHVLMPKRYRGITKKQIYRIIFKADTPAGKRFDIWLLILIGCNLVVIILDSFEAVHTNMRWVLKGLEWIFTIISRHADPHGVACAPYIAYLPYLQDAAFPAGKLPFAQCVAA